MMELDQVLLWVMSGGAGVVVFWMMENIGDLKALPPDEKRYASLLLGALLPVLAWLAAVAMGYAPQPGPWQDWVAQAFEMATVSLLASQGIHGAKRLGKAQA